MPRRPPSAEINKISVFNVYLHDSVIYRQHICLIVNKSRKHVSSIESGGSGAGGAPCL